MRLVWLPEAQADIQRLYNFLRERDPGLQNTLSVPFSLVRNDSWSSHTWGVGWMMRLSGVKFLFPLVLERMSCAIACMMKRL